MLLRSSHICRAGVRRASPGSSSMQQRREQHQEQLLGVGAAGSAFATSFSLYLLSAAPAVADVADAAGGSTPFQGVTANSLYVTLALFLMTAPGKAAAGGVSHSPCVAVVRNTAAATARARVLRVPAVRMYMYGTEMYPRLSVLSRSIPLPTAGIWSQIKRAPQAVKKRKTFEVPGPSVQGAMALDARARQIFRYQGDTARHSGT